MNILMLEDVCRSLKISTQTGRNRISKGLPMPPSFRVGRRRLFLESDLIKWIDAQAKVKTGEYPHSVNIAEFVTRGRPRKTSNYSSNK